MKEIFNTIKNAPIGSTLTYKGKEGIVIEDEKAVYECENCLYGVEGDPCMVSDNNGDNPRCPCWASEHVSGKLVIVKIPDEEQA
jgi:hypothetical protein